MSCTKFTLMETDMNTDQIKGKAKDVAGKVQQKVGESKDATRDKLKH